MDILGVLLKIEGIDFDSENVLRRVATQLLSLSATLKSIEFCDNGMTDAVFLKLLCTLKLLPCLESLRIRRQNIGDLSLRHLHGS